MGAALSARFGHAHFDSDDFYWMPGDPAFTRKREVAQRRRVLGAALEEHRRWIISGSLVSWGDPFTARFELVVFLYVPREIRMARLREREVARFGTEALAPGGARHQQYQQFMSWAEKYDRAGIEQRSLRLHNRWLAKLSCPVLRLEGDLTTEERIASIERIS